MTDALDFSWFDLKKYEPIKNCSLEEWYNQIEIRYILNYFLFSDEFKEGRDKVSVKKEWLKNEGLFHWIERIQDNPVLKRDRENCWSNWHDFHKDYPFNTYSVSSTSALNMWLSVTDDRFSDVWKCCELDDMHPLVNTPYDLLVKQKGMGDYQHLISVNVDLAASDEQIMKDFKHWLIEFREAVEYKSSKNNFTDKNLAEWFKWRLLPYLDLTLCATVEQKDLTHAKIARIIFNDEYDIDIVDRLRRTTRPKAEWLMRSETFEAIGAQLHATAPKI